VVFVGVLEPFCALDDDVELFHQVQLAAGLYDGAQRLAVEVVPRQVRAAVGIHAKMVKTDKVWGLEFGEGGGFLLESVDGGNVVAEPGQDFDGDVASQGVAGLVNGSVAALAELFLKLEFADLGQKLR